MIELRWIIRLKDDGNTEKVLQMRQEFDATIRARVPGQMWETPSASKIMWSPWQDVPTFLEEPDYSRGTHKYQPN